MATRQPGDVWAVPQMPPEQWEAQSRAVWECVERGLRNGWAGKTKDAYQLVVGHDWEGPLESPFLTFDIAFKAAELGAPVHQLFTACSLRRRSEARSES